jgi:hypothetical protein
MVRPNAVVVNSYLGWPDAAALSHMESDRTGRAAGLQHDLRVIAIDACK